MPVVVLEVSADRSGSVNGCIGSYDRKLGGYYLLHDRNDLDNISNNDKYYMNEC